MYCAVAFVLLIAAASAEDGPTKCGRVMHPGVLHCCSSMPKPGGDAPPMPPADIKECLDMPMTRPPSCDRDECFAKKKGYYAADGSIDMEALETALEKDLEKMPEALTMIKENCIKGDISQYGPPDMCDFMKMRHCTHIQMLNSCKEWSDKGDCSEVKELVLECSTMFE